ncbi:MAG: homoserine O-succinyltransferase MetX [Steroidobacteraceae bacterium]
MSESRSKSKLQKKDGVAPLGPLALHHGGKLDDVELAWRLVGQPGSPTVLAMGGISAHRQTHSDVGEAPGWWQGVVGEGCALDTTRLQVLSFDYLGGWGESSAPTLDQAWPAISPFDQAELIARLLKALNISSLRAIVGASYGGMVALAFAQRFPEQVAELAVISAAERTHPMATAWRSVQRNLVRFALRHGKEAEGLQLARALAMSTYRSPEEFAQRFSGPARFEQGIARFPVEDYLLARGADYSTRYSAASFLCLSQSIDLHQVDASRISVPTRALAVIEDQLVPIDDMRRLCAKLPNVQLREMSSYYGHDAFLKESDTLQDWLQPLTGDVT